ncbi:MAG: Do family serine endopeptidase [Alphaproteobacteria bacterium]|uniref:Do family serine endopeptidase n=1 Tax=Maricaulis alexandrii TaxID=2570354 RepID=UPI001F1E6C07|nr:Do family serine endopeptidase [Maricaulis alexandrii]MCR9266075.1 Do family serine endopeptidase [Alphaproteobacteria bacterium]
MIKHILLASALVTAPVAAQETGFTPEATLPQDRIVPDSRAEVQLSFAPIVRDVTPAVVNVYSRRVVQNQHPFANDPFFSRMFRSQPQEQNSLGSGVIVDPSGVIVTNNHVVANATELRVVLADRREYEAEILLTDETTDLAVLRVETDEPLPVLNYDMSGDIEVGDLVLAIGNPFGVGQTVTSGIVSALARTDVGRSDFGSFIQTDAAINPGNSGGALVDMDGELVGVNTMIFSRSGGSNGIGFAIPVEMVRRVVDTALGEGELIRPWLGARLQPVDSDLAQALGLDRPRGALVGEVYPDAAADDAGLRQGDVILAIDGRDINDESGARFRLATRAAGDEARFTVLRGSRELDLDVFVEAAPGNSEPVPFEAEGRNPFNGAGLVQMSPAFNERVGLDPFLDGVIVSGAARRSIAARFGFRPGDVVVEVMGEPVRTMDDLAETLIRYDGERVWPVVIERRGRRYETALQLY